MRSTSSRKSEWRLKGLDLFLIFKFVATPIHLPKNPPPKNRMGETNPLILHQETPFGSLKMTIYLGNPGLNHPARVSGADEGGG